MKRFICLFFVFIYSCMPDSKEIIIEHYSMFTPFVPKGFVEGDPIPGSFEDGIKKYRLNKNMFLNEVFTFNNIKGYSFDSVKIMHEYYQDRKGTYYLLKNLEKDKRSLSLKEFQTIVKQSNSSETLNTLEHEQFSKVFVLSNQKMKAIVFYRNNEFCYVSKTGYYNGVF